MPPPSTAADILLKHSSPISFEKNSRTPSATHGHRAPTKELITVASCALLYHSSVAKLDRSQNSWARNNIKRRLRTWYVTVQHVSLQYIVLHFFSSFIFHMFTHGINDLKI